MLHQIWFLKPMKTLVNPMDYEGLVALQGYLQSILAWLVIHYFPPRRRQIDFVVVLPSSMMSNAIV